MRKIKVSIMFFTLRILIQLLALQQINVVHILIWGQMVGVLVLTIMVQKNAVQAADMGEDGGFPHPQTYLISKCRKNKVIFIM